MSFATGPMMEDVNAHPTTLMQMPQLALHSPYQMHGYGLPETSAQNTVLNAQIAQYGQTLAQPAAGSLFQYAAPTSVPAQQQLQTQLLIPAQLPTQSLYSVAPPGQPPAQNLAQSLQPLASEHACATGQFGWSVDPVGMKQVGEESQLKTFKTPEAMAKEMFSSASDADVHLPHVHQGMMNHKKAIETLGVQHKTVMVKSQAAIKTLGKQGKLLEQQDVGLKSQKSAIMTMQKELSRLGRDLETVKSVRSRSEGPPSVRRARGVGTTGSSAEVAKQDPVKTKAAAAPVAPVKTKAAAAPARAAQTSFEMQELADTKSQLVALAQKLDRLETGAGVKTVAKRAQDTRANRTKAKVQIAAEVVTDAAIARVGRPRSKANRTWVE